MKTADTLLVKALKDVKLHDIDVHPIIHDAVDVSRHGWI
jgi:hypothetical protein